MSNSNASSQSVFRIIFLVVGLLLSCFPVGYTQEKSVDLTHFSLEELMNIEVTLASRKAERLSETAAAMFVITQDDIRRSGATNIPQLLRLVPGLQAASIDGNKWAISARGFGGRFANKMRVLIDGRSIYTPLFSGVNWDMYDVLLDDMDRIEVIRGPGATLWGANAVNGIINIITKETSETQGGLVRVGYGNYEKGFGTVRFGGSFGEHGHYRVYSKYFNRDNFVTSDGEEAKDGWTVFQSGFRMDVDQSGKNNFTFQGDGYTGKAGQTYRLLGTTPPYQRESSFDSDISGFNTLGRWRHIFSDRSDMILQVYYDMIRHEESGDDAVINGEIHTCDIDFQHRYKLGRHDFMWGFGYRHYHDKIDSSYSISFQPGRRDYSLYSAFLQDEITVIENRLRIMAGSKLEHHNFAGFEIQPNIRFVWTPNQKHSVWGSVSRAVRTPSRVDNDIRFKYDVYPPNSSLNPFPVPVLIEGLGNDDFQSENLIAYELGYRLYTSHQWSVDVVGFYNHYDQLRTGEPGIPYAVTDPDTHIVIPVMANNLMTGNVYGFELAMDVQLFPWWRMHGSYSYLKMDLSLKPESQDPWSLNIEGQSPESKILLRAMINLSPKVEFDLLSQYVDHLPGMNISSYMRLDARIGWQLSDNIEFSVIGQNLLKSHQAEYGIPMYFKTVPTEVRRGVYSTLLWKF